MKKYIKRAWAAPWIAVALALYALICLLVVIAHVDHRLFKEVWKEMP